MSLAWTSKNELQRNSLRTAKKELKKKKTGMVAFPFGGKKTNAHIKATGSTV